jgi:hypothetical protein
MGIPAKPVFGGNSVFMAGPPGPEAIDEKDQFGPEAPERPGTSVSALNSLCLCCHF